jgi:L-amino acid N-acyltransferase YncA
MSLIDVKMLPIPKHLCQPCDMPAADDAPKLTVRQAAERDADAIAAIYADHVKTGTASFDTEPRSPAETERKISEIRDRGWPFLVAERGGTVTGYAYVTLFRDRPAYGFTCEDSVYVRSDCAGIGVGSALMSELIEQSTACGFRQMMAVIGGGEPASVALHTKMGFEHAGRMRSVGRKFDRWLDTVYMQLELGKGDSTPPDTEPV